MALQTQNPIKPRNTEQTSPLQPSLRSPGPAAKLHTTTTITTMARNQVPCRNVMTMEYQGSRAPIPSSHPPKPPAAAPMVQFRKLMVRPVQAKDLAFLSSNYLLLPLHPNPNPNPNPKSRKPHG